MYITNSYKYERDGIMYVGSTVPDGATIIETLDVLNAEKGYDLIRIFDNENIGSCLWLRNGDLMQNYREEPSEIEES